jgi:hypothetical protein
MPGKRCVTGDTALLSLGDIRDRFTLISLNEAEHVRLAEEAAKANLAGGAVYDTIVPKDFVRLRPAIAERVRKPGE